MFMFINLNYIVLFSEDTEIFSSNDKENKHTHTPVQLVFSDPGAIEGKYICWKDFLYMLLLSKD